MKVIEPTVRASSAAINLVDAKGKQGWFGLQFYLRVAGYAAPFVAPHKAILAVDAILITKHTEGLEALADFLRNGIRQVARIESENLR